MPRSTGRTRKRNKSAKAIKAWHARRKKHLKNQMAQETNTSPPAVFYTSKIMDENIFIKHEPLDIDDTNAEPAHAPEEEPTKPSEATASTRPLCSLCLRDRPHTNIIFHEFDVDSYAALRDSIKDTFQWEELPARKVFICTPCWKLLKLAESFKACCLKAFSRAEQPKPTVREDDGWFSDENVKAIDGLKETVDRRIKWMERDGAEVKMEIEEPCVDGDGADKQLWQCEKCHREFPGQKSLASHAIRCKRKDVADESKLFKCHICPRTFLRKTYLNSHLNMHEGNKTHACRVSCGEMFYGSEQQHSHEKRCRKRHGLKDPSAEPEDLYQGIDPESDGNAIDIHECDKCHVRFDSWPSFRRHKGQCGTTDESKKVKTCNICSISFPSLHRLKTHLNKHRGIKPFKCRKFCEATFYGAVGRYQHEKVCHRLEMGMEAVECESCHRFFEGNKGLVMHMKTCRKEKEEDRLLYQCDFCPISFTMKFHLKAHRNKHLGQKPFECEFNCGKTFTSSLQLSKHHNKFCKNRPAAALSDSTNEDKAIPTSDHKTSTEDGGEASEFGIKTFGCAWCGLEFSTLKEKNKHVKDCQVHRCVTCRVEFFTSEALADHVKDAHVEGKLSCGLCGKQFLRRFNLLKHQKLQHSDKLTVKKEIQH